MAETRSPTSVLPERMRDAASRVVAYLLGDSHKALLGDAPQAVMVPLLRKCLRPPETYSSKGLTVGVDAAPLTARVVRPKEGVWAFFSGHIEHQELPTGLEALGKDRVVTHGDLIMALAAAIAPQLSARGGVRAAMGEAGASRKKRRSSTGTGGGEGAASSASAAQSTAPPRLPAVSYREPLLAFCTEKEAGCTNIFTSPRGLQTLLFAALAKSGAMEVSGIFKSTVSLPRVAVLRSFAWALCNHRAGGVHRAAAGEFVSPHARPSTQTNSPLPRTHLSPHAAVGKHPGRRQRDF